MSYTFYVVIAVLALTAGVYIYLHHHGKKLSSILTFLPDVTKWIGDMRSKILSELAEHKSILSVGIKDLADKIHTLSEKIGDKLDGTEDGHWDKDQALKNLQTSFDNKIESLLNDVKVQVGLTLTDFKTEMLKVAQNPKVAAIEQAAQEAATKLLADAQAEAQKVLEAAKAKLAEEAGQIGTAALNSAIDAASKAAGAAATKAVESVEEKK